MKRRARVKSIQLITMGCSKNRVDSERILKQISEAGIEIVEEGKEVALYRPEAVLINSCGFIKDAKEESIEMVLEAIEAKKRGEIKELYLFGCLSQRYREELREELPELDGIFGVFDYNLLLEALGSEWDKRLNSSRVLTTPKHWGYLKISEGCDRGCAYCSIPLIRGSHISVPIEELVEESRKMAEGGVKELIVIAQDITYYGLDLYGERRLTTLLERLSEIEGIEWIRVLYGHPTAFPESLLDLMANNPKICRYLDIPLQHIDDLVLEKMRRGIDREGTRELIRKLRERVPGIVIRTTMMVGHPGESREAFEELCNFIKEAKFERLGAFTYSQEEGTWGEKHYHDSIEEEEKERRYQELMEIQSAISHNFNLSRVGSRERVLIDSYSDGYYIARSEKESPEVDGEIVIKAEKLNQNIIGTFAFVEIVEADEYDLIARFI